MVDEAQPEARQQVWREGQHAAAVHKEQQADGTGRYPKGG
jgi:hypothetical protein